MIKHLYQNYYEELVKWCTSMTQDISGAEDLVQETFLRAMKNKETLSGLSDSQCRAWLYRTAKNLYVDKIRHGAFEVVTETMPEQSETSPDFQNLDYRELLQRIPGEERIVFVMRYLEGYNSTEIGKIFGLSPATVRTRLASARKHLRKIWED